VTRSLQIWLGLLTLLGTAGCFTGLGPRAIRAERPDYNQQIVGDDDQSSKATFSLLNVLFSLQSASGKGKGRC
jgi:hypothetical protein